MDTPQRGRWTRGQGRERLERIADSILNAALFVFHTAWIVFICVGWVWRRTRRWQLAAVLATAVSWFGLGAWYGWGYCPLTDWHWQIRTRLGHSDPPSYVQLLLRVVTGVDVPSAAADTLAVLTLGLAAVLGIVRAVRDRGGSFAAARETAQHDRAGGPSARG